MSYCMEMDTRSSRNTIDDRMVRHARGLRPGAMRWPASLHIGILRLIVARTKRSPSVVPGRTRSVTTLLYIVLALVIGFASGRYRASSFQNRGEALLSRTLRRHFPGPDYHLMNHVTLPSSKGTTQVDHVLVSRFGVFVVETKHYKGWIFGRKEQPFWTQVLFKARFKFQNPIQQNTGHVHAVRRLLDFLPPDAVKSVVVFTGEASFKTEIPSGVFSLRALVDFLREQTIEVMSLNRVQFCVGRLETTRLAISKQTDLEHVRYLERKHGRSV
jgi:hypothetical protein